MAEQKSSLPAPPETVPQPLRNAASALGPLPGAGMLSPSSGRYGSSARRARTTG